MTATARAVVWGASGHAEVVASAAKLSGLYEITGFIDGVKPERRGESLAGGPVLGGTEVLSDLRQSGVEYVLLGIGDNRARLRIAGEAQSLGFRLGQVVHPGAHVAREAQLGDGVLIAAGAVVNPCARIGRAAIVNSNAVVEHNCQIGEGVHVSPGALLAGNVRVGRLSWIGIGSIVIEGLEVGEESQLGAGSVVVRNLTSRVLAYGVPAVNKRPIA